MLSRVILQGFGMVNSPLCTDAPPKAKEKTQGLQLPEPAEPKTSRTSPKFFRFQMSLISQVRANNVDRMSEIEQAFEAVRGGQLHWFLAQRLSIFNVPVTCVSPRSIVANYKQCKSSTNVSNNWRHSASNLQGCLPVDYVFAWLI